MKATYSVPLAMLAGVGIGAVAVQTLHAQAKPPTYIIGEIEVTNVEGYTKEYAPKVQAVLKARRRSLPRCRTEGNCDRRGATETARYRACLGQLGQISGGVQFSGVEGITEDRRQVREIPYLRH